MHLLRGLSIQHKLVLLSLLTCSAVLVLAFSAFAYFESKQQRRALVEEITSISAIIGHNSAAALLFLDQEDAATTLGALRSKAYVRDATLLTPDGKVFASLLPTSDPDAILPGECAPRNAPEHGASSYVAFRQDRGALLDVCRLIMVDGLTVGTLHVVADLRRLHDEINGFIIAGAVTTLVLLILAVPLSWQLQRMISGPITELAHAMTRVARDMDYGLRVKKRSDDEVGTLIERFNDMLAQIGAHEASLTAARLEAEASNRAISAFLANTSHELRTPLNAIIGFSEVIKHQTMGGVLPAYVSYANDIWESGKHLLGIINGLLDLSKIEAGKFKLAADHIDVAEIIARVLRMTGEIGKASDLAFEVSIEPDDMILEADDRLIRQCLLNLLSNAIKFTPAGGRVRVSAAVDGDGCLQLSVGDTGIGIEQSDLATILLPFGQVEKAYNRKHTGTGLGLPLVRKFIELHGGRLEIDSKPGVGTIATLRLPAERLTAGFATERSSRREPRGHVVAKTPRERAETSSSASLKAEMPS